ncbi:class Ib ribonucleoside-diphosphate reductase assembly flavoprotein NrdI [Pediococcus argentinicus]|uniref:class Ib ribonucleoside-diphosphate reductase assembly flavoprotein NrdI n=1 Tax=Pediococcus argentinicus TaxID=480391 RepID=UPI000709F610|nr:class Ib ribonucleoside-diphosphate reductase assembly flavoprotein NrdI [Pediococcus argentinicus]NKZ22212.1 class Ib ribonucleoside-diphosphate reductase assembly flavoprotein NrdI [Pediococcus argentinicus]GEP19263.1 ribonucleotide reductase assembly protein NrdI [Pediococcus argentinicus]
MSKSIYILYISIAGNTQSFVDDLEDYAEQQHQLDANNPLIVKKEITDQTDFESETDPYFAFVPTYLDGGNGIDNGVKELMTNILGEYIAYKDNRKLCLGVIGSGNRNFNEQYCLTARRYASDYGFEMIDDYELRGNSTDCKRIYENMAGRI